MSIIARVALPVGFGWKCVQHMLPIHLLLLNTRDGIAAFILALTQRSYETKLKDPCPT
jgi:hypothetical protein